MSERPDKPCFQEPLLDESPRIKSGADRQDESGLESGSQAEPVESTSDEAAAPSGSGEAGARAESAAENNAFASPATEGSRQFFQTGNNRIGYAKTPYYGLLRHRLIVVACFCFAAFILAMSTLDLKAMVSKPAILRFESFQTGQTRIKLVDPASIAELPPDLGYFQDEYDYARKGRISELSEGLRTVVASTWAGDRYGYVNAGGKIVVKPQFAAAGEFHDGLSAAKEVNGRFGYINKSGQFVIKPQFTEASAFHDGVAAVSVEGGPSEKYGALIDRTGHFLQKSRLAGRPVELGSVYSMELSGKLGLVNKKGQWVAPPQFNKIEAIGDRARYSGYNNYGADFVNDQPEAERSVRSDYFLAWNDARCGVIDSSGKIVIPLKFSQICDYSNGVALVLVDSKYGFVDAAGNYIVEPHLQEATKFAGLTAIRDENGWSVINLKGKAAQTAPFDAPLVSRNYEWMSEGLAPVFIKGKIGYLNSKGELAIPPRFELATGFKEGYAEVWDGGLWRYIDRNGNYVFPGRFESVTPFFKGKAQVSVPGPLFFLTWAKMADETNARIASLRSSAAGYAYHRYYK